MAKRYAIWDKTSPVLTPVGAVFTPEEWIAKYPVAGLESVIVVCGAGEINGAFFGTLGQMRQMCENGGADFSACATNEEILEVIEAFEDLMNTPSDEPSVEERTAAALEFIAMSSLPDETE